ncbi:hypothetical protein QYE76_014418 [Lolium multiflorum]|uniref:Pentatricopeptide repeat-containing protein n=1 Tax=Lolium multiflorum TaxID=4521 RepID=A0AAD8U2H1_LOLMU|nr:hypothetical protein QYE76_014418 [Lolium multiflorum]
MQLRNSVSWNAIIVCYGQHGGGKEALQLFVSMLRNDDGCCCRPDELTLASLLSSCANMAAAYEATQLHAYALKRGLQGYLQVANALIMAYGKNGFLLQATQTFATIRNPDIVSWSSMVSSFAYLGCAKSAIRVFDRMLRQGVRPDGIAFLGVLSACSHAGLVQDGLKYFLVMTTDYQIDPCPQHLACLVDLLGRAGRVQDAYNVLLNMSCQTNTDVIGAFLAACKTRGNIELAKWAADRLLCLEPNESATYLLISNAYAAAGAWTELAKGLTGICNIWSQTFLVWQCKPFSGYQGSESPVLSPCTPNRQRHPDPELETAFTCHFQNHWLCITNMVRGTSAFSRDCSTDKNNLGQWLNPDDITHSRFKVQQKQESYTATEMASRRYLTVANWR